MKLFFIYSFINSVEIIFVNRSMQLTCSTAPPDKLPPPFGAHVSLWTEIPYHFNFGNLLDLCFLIYISSQNPKKTTALTEEPLPGHS